MKVILDGPDNEPFDPAKDLRVFVAYLNAPFAHRAKATLERIGQDASEQGRLVYTMWDFNSLAEPMLSGIASGEALAADIIVFAAPEAKCLPKGVRDWIADWLLRKKDFPQALVAVASLHRDPEQAQAEPVLPRYLARVAKYGSMHFFAEGSDGKAQVDRDKVRAGLAGESGTAGQKVFPLPAPLAGSQSMVTSLYGTMSPAAQRACQAAA